jgi:hypothetical protein
MAEQIDHEQVRIFFQRIDSEAVILAMSRKGSTWDRHLTGSIPVHATPILQSRSRISASYSYFFCPNLDE